LTLGGAAVVALALAGVGGTPALAAGKCESCRPWWHLNVYSAPASKENGEGTVVVQATNLGDAWVEAKEHPVTIVDTLPPGMEVTEGPHCVPASPANTGKYTSEKCVETDPADEGEWELQVGPNITSAGQNIFVNSTTNGKSGELPCSLAGQTVTCTYNGIENHLPNRHPTVPVPLAAYNTLAVQIHVKVARGRGEEENTASVSGGGTAAVTSKKPLSLSYSPRPFGVESYEMTPEEEGGGPDTQAGSHPFQLTTTFFLNTETELVDEGTQLEVEPIGSFTKDLRFNLPPGLVGNPTPLPQCPTKVFLEELNTGAPPCPDNTVVGVASVLVGSEPGGTPLNTTSLYSLEPSVGEPARFGFQSGAGPVFLDASVRTGGDYGVVVTVPNITQTAEFYGAQVTFWGVPADPRHDTTRGRGCLRVEKTGSFGLPPREEVSCAPGEEEQPFLIMPTSCTGPLHTSVEGDSWERPGMFTVPKEYVFQNAEGELLEQGGCNRLSFEPSISVTPNGTQGSSPTGLEVDVHVPQDASLAPTGLAESALKDTTVTLPAGVTLNPAAADGLLACGLGEIALESPAEQRCPEASKVGTVKIKTPLLPNELEGAAYLAAQNANPFGSLVALYLSVYDPVSGVRVRLAGEVKPDPVTGQLVSTFKDTPQLPFEDLKLEFFGGSRAPLGTPALCGSYTTSASFTPWSRNPPADVSSPAFQISSGPGGAQCSNPLQFTPSLTAGATNIQAGAFTPFTMTMSRPDGNQNLKAIQLKMPPGLLGTLSDVELCPEPQADEGLCGPNSLIGETTVSVGLGGNPFSVKGGRVYITGPYEGAPYGLSIVNPAKAGPFDLEHDTSKPGEYMPACDCVVVRAKIEVDPITAALTITSDSTGPYAIPQILDGIPLQIQHVNVTVNRPSFTFNPTNCSKMAIGGGLTSSQGATSALAVPFQVTNCATLAFKPIFKVSTAGKTSRKNGASLDVKLSYPKGSFGKDASIAKVKVDLPKQLPSRLTTLQKACTDATFNANPASCPAGSHVGSAKATTPIIPVPLSGPAYFVSHGGAKFPELVIVLAGYGTIVQLHGETFISKKGITSSTFRQVPDVPIGTFQLKLPQGTNSALAANANLCKIKKDGLKMPTAFTAQNGAIIHQSTKIAVTGCTKHKTIKHKKK
jgi:hypothetical protein